MVFALLIQQALSANSSNAENTSMRGARFQWDLFISLLHWNAS